MKKVLTAVGLAGTLLVGGLATPAQAAVGDLYDCKVVSTSYSYGTKTTVTKCKKQLSSIKGIVWKDVYSKRTVFLKGYR